MNWLAVGLLGGAVGMDATSFPQSMISRPVVSASLTGWLLGHPVEGVILGMVLEAFALVILPIGAARHPEAGTAAVAATAAYTGAVDPTAGANAVLLLLAVVFALAWEWVAAFSVTGLRKFNGRLVRLPAGATRLDRAITRRHLLGLALDFGRGTGVVLLGAFVGMLALAWLAPRMALPAGMGFGVLAAAGAAMIAALLPLFGGWSGRRLIFLLGVLCGSALLVLR